LETCRCRIRLAKDKQNIQKAIWIRRAGSKKTKPKFIRVDFGCNGISVAGSKEGRMNHTLKRELASDVAFMAGEDFATRAVKPRNLPGRTGCLFAIAIFHPTSGFATRSAGI
jgi:hypothetical protein